MNGQETMHQSYSEIAVARCGKIRILYVDLNPESIPGTTDEVLRNHGHPLLYVNTSRGALEMIRNQDFDAVVIAQDNLEVFDLIARVQAIREGLPVFVTCDWSISELPLALEWCGGLREAGNHLHV